MGTSVKDRSASLMPGAEGVNPNVGRPPADSTPGAFLVNTWSTDYQKYPLFSAFFSLVTSVEQLFITY